MNVSAPLPAREPLLTPVRLIFILSVAVLVLGWAGWRATGNPFPGQRLRVATRDLAGYRDALGRIGMVPEDPAKVDARAWTPTGGTWRGVTSTFITADGQYRVAVWVGAGTDPRFEAELSRGDLDGWRKVSTGKAEGIARTWAIPGHRHGGVAIWNPTTITIEDLTVANDLVDTLRNANP